MKKNSKKKKLKIPRDIIIEDLAEEYPEVVNFLIYEYGFHCVSCIVSGFERLEDGARVHGIEGDDFEEMLQIINEMAGDGER